VETSNYKDLLSLPGYEEIKQILDSWRNVAVNIADHLEDGKIIIPNYFIVSPPGTGISHLIDILANELSHLGLMPFSNQKKAIEFLLEYQEDKESFSGFERLYTLLEHGLSQYGEPFAGVLVIDITEWVENLACEDKRFIRFLHYLVKRDDIQMIIFVSNCRKTNHVKDCESIISSILRIERIEIKSNPSDSLVNKLLEYLNNLGLKVDPSGKALLLETVDYLSKQRNYNGLKTLKNLAKDITYKKYSLSENQNKIIDSKDLVFFSKDGKWIKQFKSGFFKKADYEGDF